MRLVIVEKKELAKAIADVYPGTGEIHKEYIKKMIYIYYMEYGIYFRI